MSALRHAKGQDRAKERAKPLSPWSERRLRGSHVLVCFSFAHELEQTCEEEQPSGLQWFVL